MNFATVSEARSPAKIRIGCSGWNYRHWRGTFYPEKMPSRSWFAFYAEQFDTVEINNSFYRLPPCDTFRKWRDQAPEGFCYAVKANRFLTQAKKLKDCEEALKRQMDAFRCLGDRLGPILYQLPPSFTRNLERLDSFLQVLPPNFVNVFEFRHRSWYVQETYDLLGQYGAVLCVHDMPGCGVNRVATGPANYVRFHGGEGKYWGRYPEGQMRDWAEWLVDQAEAERSSWVFFNNDIHADAIADARVLKSLVCELLG